ncbi:MAG: PHP domain-containing protein [Lachnospiraceae bacterium]|nr:PHP domain-containing protein [Lachnospiraceae bacterium]
MSKGFLEVFPALAMGLSVEEARTARHVRVEKVQMPKNGGMMRVHVVSQELVSSRYFRKLEKKLTAQMGASQEMDVRILERFSLAMEERAAFNAYWESAKEEISAYRPIYGMILEEAEWAFQDTELLLTIPDNIFAREFAEDIRRILDKIMQERLSLSLSTRIQYSYKERKNPGLLRKYQDSIENVDNGEADSYENPEQPFSFEEVPAADSEAVEVDNNENYVNSIFSGSGNGDPENPKKKRKRGEPAEGFLYGRDVSGDILPLSEIIGDMPEAVVRGKVMRIDRREIKTGSTLVIADITDQTDSITFKLFLDPERVDAFFEGFTEGVCVLIKGSPQVDDFDKELTMGRIRGLKLTSDFFGQRMDEAAEKRVELHCHTKMSDMDGVSEVSDIIKQAYRFGHKAIAITDHGVVQSFPDAYSTWGKLFAKAKDKALEKGENPPTRDEFFKVIYGVEAYLVDDTALPAYGDLSLSIEEQSYVVFDLETTGFSPERDRIIEIGAVKVEKGQITERFSQFVNPQMPIPPKITELTSITDQMVKDAEPIAEALPKFLAFIKDCVLVAHNASFDTGFIKANCLRLNFDDHFTWLDTLQLSRMLFPEQVKHTLDAVAKALDVSLAHHHRAVDDAECTAGIFLKMTTLLKKKGYGTFQDLNANFAMSPLQISRTHAYHAILLAKNDVGRINLYRLVSESHLNYLGQGRPKMPKSLIQKYREGLILGSACEAGELYRAILEGRSSDDIKRIAEFYDYLEIQPLGNNAYMIDSPKIENVHSEKDLEEINIQIVELAESLGKPYAATCDVHFLNPEEEVFRRILMVGNGMNDAEKQPPLYLHTTEEMLEEFAYLGPAKAREAVIVNPQRIADWCEPISPLRPDKCPPVIQDSDKTLREICYT